MKIQSGSHPAGQDQGLIQMFGVEKTYQTSAGGFTALRGIDLTLKQGEFAA
jgi:ABC-type lipoprotein export system ATPase subunit